MPQTSPTPNHRPIKKNHLIGVMVFGLLLSTIFYFIPTAKTNDYEFHYNKTIGQFDSIQGHYTEKDYEEYPGLFHLITEKTFAPFESFEPENIFKAITALFLFLIIPSTIYLLIKDYWKTIAYYAIGFPYATWHNGAFPEAMAILLFIAYIHILENNEGKYLLSLVAILLAGLGTHNAFLYSIIYASAFIIFFPPLKKFVQEKKVHFKKLFPATVILQKKTLTDPLLLDPFMKSIPLPILYKNKKTNWKFWAAITLILPAFMLEYRLLHPASILAILNLDTQTFPKQWKLVILGQTLFQTAIAAYFITTQFG